MSQQRREIGYIGLNHHHAEPYLKSIEDLPVEITGACEPDESVALDSIDGLEAIPTYRSVTELLDREQPDLVWLTLSNEQTPEVIIEAVERGIDVFTEKPVARTAADLRPVIDSVEESEATVGVSYSWRGHPIAQELRDRVEEDFFGDVHAFETRFLTSKPAYRDTDHYLFDRSASRGGIVQWLGIHWIDLLPWILDDPIEQVNASLNSRSDAIDVEDGATIQFETESGALGTLQCGYYLREERYDTHVAIYGDEGRSRWDPIGRQFGFDGETELELESVTECWDGTAKRTINYDYEPQDGYGGEWGLEFLELFLEAMDEGNPVPVSLEDALTVLEVLDAVYESAETDQWVSVGTERSVPIEQD
ncbi:Gfo/Idh/MocA family oxidoreductase [Natronolimnobius sp. AArcel1]|uniref:Gfo/Idh/MocA family protein n=1 Tax=Natronolimnobius sp. AArcel1 TaxID=1679093 RepID=UPI0013ED9487|nr:Gfo/Idh/MocA family oxidoreductase [Natronolimnobius sp. AArcel1]NGM70605.1 Gfo/Idh/MocA family oxidoreductase [Natronolimnobius sp. AArcel1]